MRNARRSAVTVATALGLSAPLVSGCGGGVISDAGTVIVEHIPPSTCDSHLPDGCLDTCYKAEDILTKDCASCHDSTSSPNPPSPIANYFALVNVTASSSFPGEIYVVPGSPEESLLYQRTAIVRDMPPPASDSSYPRPTSHDDDILAQWIRQCVPVVASPLVRCPADPPAGSCLIPGMTCPYSDQTCACKDSSWACQPCPATQPSTGAACPADPSALGNAALLRCGYGQATCSCNPDPNGGDSPAWGCGVCPGSQPSIGQTCGDTTFSCAYGDQLCECTQGVWDCLSPRCPLAYVPFADTFPPLCAGFYGCRYPVLDQSCTCKTSTESLSDPRAWINCTCPAAPPKEWDNCVPTNAPPCSYSDQTCACVGGLWQCQRTCPAVMPTDGSSCDPGLNCSYGAQLCYCDGIAWHCS